MTADLRREEIARMKESNVTIEALDLTPTQALGVALSVAAPSMLMEDAQRAAPDMLAHIEAMEFRLVRSQDTATARIAALEGALRDMIGTVAFVVSCVLSGEPLSEDDQSRINTATKKARAALSGETRTDGETT